MELQLIQSKILEIRGFHVMLDFQLAELYRVETKNLKRAVKRNIERFPYPDFMFELTKEEWDNLRCNFGTSNLGGIRYMPFAFSREGISMLSSVLTSKTAIEVNISIMRAFVLMRQMAIGYDELLKRIEELEAGTDAQFSEIYLALTQLLSKPEPAPRKRIGFKQNYDE